MSDLSKTPDYEKESDNLTHLAKILIALHNFLETHPVQYPLAVKVYMMLSAGSVPKVKVKCKHGQNGKCQVTGKTTINGLPAICQALDEAMGALELELDLQEPSATEPTRRDTPDYFI